jgi:riboflavin synthase
MFTGIVEELGIVDRIENYRGIRFIVIKTDKLFQDTKLGDSIAVNGVCLTVADINKSKVGFEIISETLNNTNLRDLRLRDKVNLERSLKLNGRLSGHLVSGHIDCIGIIRNKYIKYGNTVFEIAIPDKIIRYIIPKGSIAVDGISLTITEIRGNMFSINIIPHTLKVTTFGIRRPSDRVNIEVDIIGKYVTSILNREMSRDI